VWRSLVRSTPRRRLNEADLREQKQAITESFDARNHAHDAVSELELVAPRPVADLAGRTMLIVIHLGRDGTGWPDFVEARHTLFMALRGDLEDETSPEMNKPRLSLRTVTESWPALAHRLSPLLRQPIDRE
jgi:hypothetical protein